MCVLSPLFTAYNSLKTPKSFNHHEFIDTSNESVYWVPRVYVSVFSVLGTIYDNIEECISMYRKYTSTADPKNDYRQVRTSNFRICGCKARVVVDLVPGTTKCTLTIFDVEHNHELDRIEYKHLSKAERKLSYTEHLFIIKDVNANIGVVRAHNLYTGLKGSSSLVHGCRAVRTVWADEVAKCNYKEFGDIVSFDVTYKTNKYKMVFVPFIVIDNHRRCVTVGSGLLKKEIAEAYGWLLRAFRKAFVRAPNIVVTDQDGAMRLAIAVEFLEYKHRFCCGISCRRSHPR
ncbi:FAR1-related sequence 5-like protein [Tanacetum coccineum]